jgi:carbonic anhydrase/acetyltransferase-like protein (isoleucine patch superfamily)
MKKKYKLVKNDTITINGRTLYRIKAVRNFANIKKGDLGGYIESEQNLSHEGNCWVADNAVVHGNAEVKDNAVVKGNAEICGNAKVYQNALVCDNAFICGNAEIYGFAQIRGRSYIFDRAKVFESAKICDNVWVRGNSKVYGSAYACGIASISGNAEIFGSSYINGGCIKRNAKVYGLAQISNWAVIDYNAKVYGNIIIRYGHLTKDIKDTELTKLIGCCFNVYPINGKYYLYMNVRKIDNGKYCTTYKCEREICDNESYIASNIDNLHEFYVGIPRPVDNKKTYTIIGVEVDKDDVVGIEGMFIRCKRIKVLGEITDWK